MSGTLHQRLIAIDVRPRRFGYVVFEAPIRLVDWGTGSCNSNTLGTTRLAYLFRLSGPSTVVLRRISAGSKRDRAISRVHVVAIQAEARRLGIATKFVPEKEIRAVFQQNGRRNKHEIASQIAACFPELKWKLPAKRKPWQTEDRRMLVFDAAALALVYLSRFDGATTPDSNIT